MPPKFKFTREEIVAAALELVRRDGMSAMTARAVGEQLSSSSKVIFSLFENMEELQREVISAANLIYNGYLQRELASGEYLPYKASGMGYIRFAKEEKELFRLLFMRDRTAEPMPLVDEIDDIILMIMDANGLSRNDAELLHLEMWACVHGIASMIATSYLELDWELISRMVSDVYLGTRSRFVSKEGK